MKTVLNLNNPNNKKNKLFLGEKLGITNFADCKYPIFKTLYDKQLSFFWRPGEISMVKDSSDILNMSETERFVFEENLAFQTQGDAFLGKGIEGIMEHVTNNELYQSLKVHSFFEDSIHTPSYSHVFEGIYNNPAEKFYSILENPSIIKRAEKSVEKFNTLLNSKGDVRLEIANAIICLLSLESISFYNSFLTSFYFARRGLMTGNGSIISLIARDENLHKSNCINILKILLTREEEGFFDLRGVIIDNIYNAFLEMAKQEFEWIDHLFSKGELSGLTKNGLTSYVKFLTNNSINSFGSNLGFKERIFEETVNPFPWVKSFQGSSKDIQVAPQEQQITNYVKSSKNDVDNMDFDF